MSMFSPRIQLKPLIGLCRRVGTSLEAGVDIRTVFEREADRATGHLRRHLRDISRDLKDGISLAASLNETADYFPLLFRQLAEVGEQTGHLDAVLLQLAEQYEIRQKAQRIFLAAIIWPMAQLCFAIAIVGFLIGFMGALQGMTGMKIDILGFGLIGTDGLIVYFTFIGAVAAGVWLVVRAINRGLVWTRPIQHFFLKLPGLGKPLQIMALARLAWAMHLTMNTSMDVRRSLKLSLLSTRNARYIDQIPDILTEIVAGNSIHEAFCAVGGYPADFLDTLAISEQSGKIVESMGTLSRQYQEQAKLALTALSIIAGWAVWAVVAAIIILLIFRIFSFYVGQINAAMS